MTPAARQTAAAPAAAKHRTESGGATAAAGEPTVRIAADALPARAPELLPPPDGGGASQPTASSDAPTARSGGPPAEAGSEPPGDAPAPLFAAPPNGVVAAQEAGVWRMSLRDAVRSGLVNNKDIAVLQVTPAADATLVSTQMAAFDPVAGLNAVGGNSYRQVRSTIATFGAPVSAQRTDTYQPYDDRNNMFLRRRLHTGGDVEVGFASQYLDFVPQGAALIVNPGWDSSANFRFRQPLARGRGADVNDAPIRIARATASQSQFEFLADVRRRVLAIDQAYWRLAGARRRLQTASTYYQLAEKFNEQERERNRLGLSARPDLLQTEAIVASFETLEATSERDARVAEVRLRSAMGLALAGLGLDDDPAVCDEPLAELPMRPAPRVDEQDETVDVALATPTAMRRPELLAQKSRIEAVEHALVAARNGLTPNLRAQVDYATTGLGEGLDRSIHTTSRFEYSTWSVGMYYERRLGLRSERAEVRRVELLLARETARERQIAHDIVGLLRETSATVDTQRRLLATRQGLVRTAREQLEAYDELYREDEATLFQRLTFLNTVAQAELQEVDAWTELQLALAQWRFERGDNFGCFGVEVTAGEGAPEDQPLPTP